MERIKINGKTKLVGEVNIAGAKNSAVALIPATILVKGISIIDNIPDISDLKGYYEILEELGATVEILGDNKVKIDTSNVNSNVALSGNVKAFRASYYLLGILFSMFNSATVGMPGGCNIGKRPIDQHIKGFEQLGAKVEYTNDYVKIEADKIIGTTIDFDVVSVGATINVMLGAVKAEGTTILNNCAKEPHIVDVANFLNEIGAKITGAGTDTIIIEGVDTFKNYVEYSVVPDQIEAGTYMIAAVATKGDILVKNCVPEDMEFLINELVKMGATVEIDNNNIRVVGNENIVSSNIETSPHPGFATDLQSQMGALFAITNGTSTITENIWESRFGYCYELEKMGAKVTIDNTVATFDGVDTLVGTEVKATDLRAGASLIIAGCVANGVTTITNLHHIDRGYEKIEEKFRNLGAQIERENYND